MDEGNGATGDVVLEVKRNCVGFAILFNSVYFWDPALLMFISMLNVMFTVTIEHDICGRNQLVKVLGPKHAQRSQCLIHFHLEHLVNLDPAQLGVTHLELIHNAHRQRLQVVTL